MPTVFISHSSQDHEVVSERLVKLLQSHGLGTFYSRDSIHGAQEWEKRIRQGLQSSDWFLVALSPRSIASEWVQAEVDWAFSNRKGKIVPVLIDDCNPEDCHLRLRQLQYVDLRDSTVSAQAHLLSLWGIPLQAGASAEADANNDEKSEHRHYGAARPHGHKPFAKDFVRTPQAIIAGAVAVAAIVSLAVWLLTRPAQDKVLPSGALDASLALASDTHGATKSTDSKNHEGTSLPGTAVPPPSPDDGADTSSKPSGDNQSLVAHNVVSLFSLAKPLKPTSGETPDLFQFSDTQAYTTATYHEKIGNDSIAISYSIPYLDNYRAGKTLEGQSVRKDVFAATMPELSIKVLNNSPRTILVADCIVSVSKSTVDSTPLLVVSKDGLNRFLILNEGWGAVVDPVVTFQITSINDAGDGLFAPKEHRIVLETFDTEHDVLIGSYIPEKLTEEPVVRVQGAIEYGPTDARLKRQFATTVNLSINAGDPAPPSFSYDLQLEAGASDVSYRVPMSQEIKAGEADQFLLRISSDKTAHYDLELKLLGIDRRELGVQKVSLDIFVPRSQVGRGMKKLEENPYEPKL